MNAQENVKRLAVLISGNGSNLQAIIDAIQTNAMEAQLGVVVSNRPEAYGLLRAERAGVPTLYFPLDPYQKSGHLRSDYEADLAELIAAYEPDLVVLAGWMLILSPAFLDHFPDRVINLHPALPGQFPGTHAIERAYQAFQQGQIEHTGIMVHRVIPEIDAGPVIVTAKVPIEATDSLSDLESRIHATEHRLIVEAIRRVFSGS
jgi:formyltetrahydrofolate-dependent phosphoribosylglycinamide formyltransferase